MVTSTNKIYDEIKTYIAKKGDPFPQWHVGITSNVFERLFVEHGVSQKQGFWIYKQCPDNRAAKRVVSSLIRLGCGGWAGGWDSATNTVYAYLKSPGTNP